MIHTELDRPPDIKWRCKVCGEEMTVRHYWVEAWDHNGRWLHPTIHDRCVEIYERNQVAKKFGPVEREIPERFRDFDPAKADKAAQAAAQAFLPDSKVKTLAIIGVPSRGKSRLMWAVVTQFFDVLQEQTGAKRWVDYFLFADLVSELDRPRLNQLKWSKHAFLDDVGSVESYGKERASLQQIIRYRIQKGEHWTFLTIDSLKFDEGLEDLMRGRATVIYLDK